MSSIKINKAVILAAGFGTRFLPASKTIPKVMFPVIDKPIIQLVVEELVEAGIIDITFVLSSFTQEIKEHFEPFPALDELLEKSGKKKELATIKNIESMANFSYVEQKKGRHGIGMAILSAKESVGEEPFMLTWGDEFYLAQPGRFVQLLQAYQKYDGTFLGCLKTSDPNDGAKYGFVVGEKIDQTITKVKGLVEKPGAGKAPSDLACLSGMIFGPEIFTYLERADSQLPEGKELYHMDGLKLMLEDNLPIYALEYQNCRYFDTGDKFGYLKALVEFGLKSPEFGEKFKDFLKKLKLE